MKKCLLFLFLPMVSYWCKAQISANAVGCDAVSTTISTSFPTDAIFGQGGYSFHNCNGSNNNPKCSFIRGFNVKLKYPPSTVLGEYKLRPSKFILLEPDGSKNEREPLWKRLIKLLYAPSPPPTDNQFDFPNLI